MRFYSQSRFKRRLIWSALVLIGVPLMLAVAGNFRSRASTPHKVFIAFGFHVNLYHSFRNDTNDADGFGKDIRIIRHIIRTLDHYNARGVPVRGVWDFDNLFSLQEILPRHAPDIITDIQRRVRQHGDEVILMSYNNGLVSAMTHAELDRSVAWAISNPWQSGVRDLFGNYAPIVRPQEMMTTPGNFSVYRRHGVQAVSLYYSATPFDAMRMFTRPLTRAEAHNPVLYRHAHTGEEMVVIPTYHFGDLMEHVSLRQWVQELGALQQRGELNRDALIFINYDADSELWEGVDLPWLVSWLPSTDGLGGLIEEVGNLPQAAFTTLRAYLDRHPPVGTISFSQDTADGSFNGYNSWAEKADVHAQWTTIQRSRRMRAAALRAISLAQDEVLRKRLQDCIDQSDMLRLRALSTTNFGMATPFVARQREAVMAGLMRGLEGFSDQIHTLLSRMLSEGARPLARFEGVPAHLRLVDTLLILPAGDQPHPGRRFLTVRLSSEIRAEGGLVLAGPDGRQIPTRILRRRAMQDGTHLLSLLVSDPDSLPDGFYQLFVTDHARQRSPGVAPGQARGLRHLSNERLRISFREDGIEGIYLDGERQTDGPSLKPYLRWAGKTYYARTRLHTEGPGGQSSPISLRMTGPFPGPPNETRTPGWMDYHLTLVADRPYLLVEGRVRYPQTVARDAIKPGTPGLVRRADLRWQDVAPAEIRFAPRAGRQTPVQVLKHNYLGVSTQYALDYYRFDDRNLNLDNVNNHITDAYVGWVAGDAGMAVCMDTSVQSNFAFAPLRLHYHPGADAFGVHANPFGTYHGRQYTPPTWGNRNGFDLTLLAGEQFASAAPTYNGRQQDFSLMLVFFKGPQIPPQMARDLEGFAHPPVVISAATPQRRLSPGGAPAAPRGFVAAYTADGVRFSWDRDGHAEDTFRVRCGLRPGQYETVYTTTGNSMRVAEYTAGRPFTAHQRYVAVVERVAPDGRVSPPSPEIQFFNREVAPRRPQVPLGLELRVLWANLQASLTSLRL